MGVGLNKRWVCSEVTLINKAEGGDRAARMQLGVSHLDVTALKQVRNQVFEIEWRRNGEGMAYLLACVLLQSELNIARKGKELADQATKVSAGHQSALHLSVYLRSH